MILRVVMVVVVASGLLFAGCQKDETSNPSAASAVSTGGVEAPAAAEPTPAAVESTPTEQVAPEATETTGTQ